MFYARINEVFGQLVDLIEKVLNSTKFFLIFFISWDFVFSWLYRIAGAEVDADKDPSEHTYRKLPTFMRYFMEIFRNTVGDVQTP